MQRVPSALLLETDTVAPLSRLFASSGMRGDAPRRALFRFILSLISGVELRGRDCTFTYHLFQLESAEAILDCTFLIHVLLGRFFFFHTPPRRAPFRASLPFHLGISPPHSRYRVAYTFCKAILTYTTSENKKHN